MNNIPHPREATRLFGRDAAEELFCAALAAGRLPHAWVIAGPEGTGKATLAFRLARRVLHGGPQAAQPQWELAPDHPIFRRIVAGSHTDLLSIEPPEAEKGEEGRREITVEQARAVGEFLAHTPAEGDWRVVIVDSADDMNVSASNAILKVLEEPPPRALLLLVSHNPGRLLSTIRSRCRTLRLSPLPDSDFQRALSLLAPDVRQDEDEAEALRVLSGGSPGLALTLRAHETVALYGRLVQAVQGREPGEGLTAFAEPFGGAHGAWQVLSVLVERLLARAVETHLIPGTCREIVPGEAAAWTALLQAHGSPQALAEACGEARAQFSVAARAHLDYKTVVMTLLHALRHPQPA